MRWVVVLILSLLLSACSSDPKEMPAPPNRPGGGSTAVEAPDISAELADPSPRIVLVDTTVRYDHGGVIMGRRGSVLYLLDIATGWHADYDASAATLSVNGQAIPIKDAKIERRAAGTTWYVATPADDASRRIVFVTRY